MASDRVRVATPDGAGQSLDWPAHVDVGHRALEPGRLIALNGEAGYQAHTLAPGLHFGYWRWQYRIIKVPIITVPQGEIALVIAADGMSIPPQRILGRCGWAARDERHKGEAEAGNR